MAKEVRKVVIYDWMLKRLGLTTNELLVYAYVYSHTDGMDRKYQYSGTIAKLSKELNLHTQTTQRALDTLVECDLLTKTESIYHARNWTYAINFEYANREKGK